MKSTHLQICSNRGKNNADKRRKFGEVLFTKLSRRTVARCTWEGTPHTWTTWPSISSYFGGSLTNILVMVFLLCLRFMLARGFRENGCETGKSQDECQKQHSSRLQDKYKDKEITEWDFYAARPIILRLLPRF